MNIKDGCRSHCAAATDCPWIKGKEAAAQFQKVLDHPGVVINFALGSLAHLGLARAYALDGDKAKSRAAYDDFLELWKDGDAENHVLRQAKYERGLQI